MIDGELVTSLIDMIFKTYGWKATSLKSVIGELILDVRADERAKFAKFMYNFLVENEYLTVTEVLDRIRNNDHYRADAFCK